MNMDQLQSSPYPNSPAVFSGQLLAPPSAPPSLPPPLTNERFFDQPPSMSHHHQNNTNSVNNNNANANNAANQHISIAGSHAPYTSQASLSISALPTIFASTHATTTPYPTNESHVQPTLQ